MTQPTPVHCYTNPSFCRQSEHIPDDRHDQLPPPPQFQGVEELPLPPPPISIPIPIESPQRYQPNHGHTNPAFQNRTELDSIELDRYAKTPQDRYCYLEDNRRDPAVEERRVVYDRNTRSRYEYIDDEEPPLNQRLQRRASLSRFEIASNRQSQHFARQPSYHGQQLQGLEDGARVRRVRQDGNDRYGMVPADEAPIESSWTTPGGRSPPRGEYFLHLYTFKKRVSGH